MKILVYHHVGHFTNIMASRVQQLMVIQSPHTQSTGSHHHLHLTVFVCAEYVNAQEIPTDMKSITDRAAQTLLWTELFRGQLHTHTL